MLSPLLYVSIVDYSEKDYNDFFKFLKDKKIKYNIYYETEKTKKHKELVIKLIPEMLFVEELKKEYLEKLFLLFSEFEYLTPVFEFIDEEGDNNE